MDFNSATNNRATSSYDTITKWAGSPGTSATADWNSTYSLLEKSFANAGISVSGEAWKPPEIVFWNLNAGKVCFPSNANTPGVRFISGFSADLMKLFLDDDIDSHTEVTPWSTLENALNDTRYDPVREIMDMMDGGDGRFNSLSRPTLKHYNKTSAYTHEGGGAGAATPPSTPSSPLVSSSAGWVEVDYSTTHPTMSGSKVPSKDSVSKDAIDKVAMRKQLAELQKQQMDMMEMQKKLIEKLDS